MEFFSRQLISVRYDLQFLKERRKEKGRKKGESEVEGGAELEWNRSGTGAGH
jgi:hypothetical protein